MQLFIRPSTPDDDPALLELHHAVYPDQRMTMVEYQFQQQERDPRHQFQRWIVEQDGSIVAAGEYDQDFFRYRPHTFVIDGMVHPTYQHQGIGSKLYEHIMEALRPLHPRYIRKRIRAEMTPGIRFLIARGFQEGRSIWESYLDLTTFDPDRFATDEQQKNTRAFEFSSIEDLKGDPQRDRKLCLLVSELGQDVPLPEPRLPLRYDDFIYYRLYDPHLVHTCSFVALHQGEYVGIAELKMTANPAMLTARLTAVKRAYREKGIARELKLRSIAAARTRGYSVILTTNDARNAPIFALNEQLGFVKQHLWLELEKQAESQ